ncbi:MAG: putative rane protein [Herbinix sp.]|nr:putative rane protein [Herbinix sp.]
MLYSRKTNVIFGILQIILYLAFLTLDLTDSAPNFSVAIKYTIIIVCFCYAFFTKSASRSILFLSVLLHKLAMFFTVLSDLFLLVLDIQLLGILTFILVQIFYGLRISIVKKHDLVKEFTTRIIIQAVLTLFIAFILKQINVLINPLLVATIFYFIYILTNTILAIMAVATSAKYKRPSMKLFTIGMVLFLLCDINVGLFNMASFITMPENIYVVVYSLSSILMWTFYAPSQVLLAYSTQAIAKENVNESV